MQAVIFVLVLNVATCNDGSASYPKYILLLTIPVALWRGWTEWTCLKLYLPKYVKDVKRQLGDTAPFKIMGANASFSLWICTYLGFSCLNFSDISTDSVFAALTWKSYECPRQQLGTIWQVTMRQSMFGASSVSALSHLPYLVFGAWVVSLIQTIYPVIHMMGTKAGDVKWKTVWSRDEVFNIHVFGVLAEASAMASVQNMSAIEVQNVIARSRPHTVGRNGAVALSQQMRNRVLLSYNAENVLQLNIQVSIFSMNAYIFKRQLNAIQIGALLSIILGILSSLAKLAEAQAFF